MSDLKHFVNTCTTMLNEEFTEQECEILSTAFKLRKLSCNDVLLREGEQDDTLYIVVDGDIAVTCKAGGDDQVTLHHLKAGDIAGAMGFIDGSSHSATLSATRNSHVLELHRDALEEKIDAHPQLTYKVMKMIIRSVHKTMIQMNRQFVEMNNYIMREHGRY